MSTYADIEDADIDLEKEFAEAEKYYPVLTAASAGQDLLYAAEPQQTQPEEKGRVSVKISCPIPEALKKDAGELADYVDDYATIMTAHVRAKARQDRNKFLDLQVWEDAYRGLPAMIYEVVHSYEFKYEGVAAEVSTKLVLALLAGVAGNKLAAGAQFKSFLSEQQDKLRAEAGRSKEPRKLIVTATGVVADPELPRLHGLLNLFLLDENNTKTLIKTSCASAEHVNISIKGLSIQGRFNHRAMRRESTRKLIEEFIEKRINDDIRQSMNWNKTSADSA